MKAITLISIFLFVGVTLYWVLSKPQPKNYDTLANLNSNLKNGEYIFTAAGCINCHANDDSNNKLLLSGGKAFVSSFGVVYAPNISMSKEFGIGNWSISEFINATRNGISPSGQHYFPVFPYTSYSRMTDQDLVDLWSFLQTLPNIEKNNIPHQVFWPFSIRRNIGIWKIFFLDDDWIDNSEDRGAYLVEGIGHCAECHTPRNIFGAIDKSRWMKGTRHPDGKSLIPGITPKQLTWSINEISEYLSSGFTPDYDVAGGDMAAVIENTSKLRSEDRGAIARYLFRLSD